MNKNCQNIIILISGFAGTGKTRFGKKLAQDLNYKFIDICDFVKKDYDIKYVLPNGINVVDYDSVDAFDWEKINNEINGSVVISGQLFPKDAIKQEYINIQLTAKKQTILNNRLEYAKKHPEKHGDEESEKLIFNTHTYSYYLGMLKNIKTNDDIFIDGLTDGEAYEKIRNIVNKQIEFKCAKEKQKLEKPAEKKKQFVPDNFRDFEISLVTHF